MLDSVKPSVADLFEDITEGTTGAIDCEWCGTSYPERNLSDDSYWYMHFAQKQVVQCCFEKVALELVNFMPKLVPWYMKQLTVDDNILRDQKEDLKKLLDFLREARSI